MLIFLPPAPSATSRVIVYVHGGGLKDNNTDNPDLYAAAAPMLASHDDIVSVYFDYRLGRVPDQVVLDADDVGCAVTWVQRYLTKLVRRLDSYHLELAGYSAGAELAAMIALQPTYITQSGGDPAGIRGVASMSGRYKYEIVPRADDVSINDWESMHGSGNSPYDHAAQTSFPWLLTYEVADADTQFGNFDLMLARLRGAGNIVFGYENPDPNKHGQGLEDLQNAHSAFYREFVTFADHPTDAKRTTGSEKMILNSDRRGLPSGIDFGAQDVAVGGDGAIWVVEDPLHSSVTSDQYVAKYSNAVSKSSNPSIGPFPFFEDLPTDGICCTTWLLGERIGVDGNGTPWVVNAAGALFEGVPLSAPPSGSNGYIVGSLNASGWAPIPLPTAVSAADVAGGGTLDKPYLWIVDTNGGIWQYQYQSSSFTQDTGLGVGTIATRIAVDSNGVVYVVDSSHVLHVRTGSDSWETGSGKPLIDVGAGSAVYGVGTDHRVYAIEGASTVPLPGPPGPSNAIAVSADGHPVVVTTGWGLDQVH